MANTDNLPHRLGGYELEERVGTGGMGTVYRAIDPRTRTRVAVKLIHPHLQADSAFVDRFRDEAHLASLMTSPYIVRVLEFGFDDGKYFLVTEFVEGSRLSDLIAGRRLTVDEALAITSQVAMALQAAAAHQVLHRDVKPDNIIVTSDKAVKLMDFGVARLSYVETQQLFLGTIAYAAPEQFRGQTTIQSDIYSLGVVLFQMLAGELPFKGSTLSSLIRMHDDVSPPLEKLAAAPPALREIVAKCLEKETAKRFQNPSELLAALRAVRTTASSADDSNWLTTTTAGLASAATVVQPSRVSSAQLQPSPPSAASPQAVGSAEGPSLTNAPVVTTNRKGVPPLVLIAGGSGLTGIAIVLALLLLGGSGHSGGRKAANLAPAAIQGVTSVPSQPSLPPAVIPPPAATLQPAAPSSNSRTDSLAAIAGIWRGNVSQPGEDPYPVVMTISPASSQINYPSLNCGGSLQFLRMNGSTFVFAEKIEHGVENCITDGRVETSRTGSGLSWVWFYQDGSPGATATLTSQ